MSARERPAPEAEVFPDQQTLAAAAGTRLLRTLRDAQQARGAASVVLTGGGVGIALLEQIAGSTDVGVVDWGRVEVWWGDERFVAPDDPERNEGQARAALLDALDLDPARVHPMAADPGAGDPDAGADAYAAELRSAAPAGQDVPAFDVVLLGMGPEGHTASIFPGSPAAHDARTVLAVRECPKPPPTRISLGFTALRQARQVWFVVAGQAKAPMVAEAFAAGADRARVPASGVTGTEATRWLLDEAAAGRLPASAR